MNAKQIREMTDDQLNRLIAERRGWRIEPTSFSSPFRSKITCHGRDDFMNLDAPPDDPDVVWRELLSWAIDWDPEDFYNPHFCTDMNAATRLLPEMKGELC
jgi:hypothetical protein